MAHLNQKGNMIRRFNFHFSICRVQPWSTATCCLALILWSAGAAHAQSTSPRSLDPRLKVELFAEKPQTSSGLISGGFFVFSRRLFDLLTTDDGCDLERGPLENLAREGQLMVYDHRGDWACVDTYRDLQHLNHVWNAKEAFWKVWE
jgi:ADP-glucose pyrophosphorylase